MPYLKSEQRSVFPVKSDEKKKKKKCGLTPSHKVIYSGSWPAGELERAKRLLWFGYVI
jgi:hypothetical protein